MSKLYSWLQSEDNGKDVGKLYWDEQFKKFKLSSVKQRCDEWILSIVSQEVLLSNIKKSVEIEFLDSSPFSYIHAQWNPNSNKIEVYNEWIIAYEEYMTNEQAVDVHIYHELYHLYEDNNELWYDSYKYRQRNFISEYCALEISRRISNLEFSCVVYDLCVQTENDEEAICELERRLNNETTNR